MALPLMTLSLGVPLTVQDVWDIPGDGRRYELLEGVLIVTPAPGAPHQTCVARTWSLLDEAKGPEHLVLLAPFDWVAGPDTLLQPDVMVALRADVAASGDKRLERPPILVVEVASRSTRMIDRGSKRLAFQAAGVPTYWLVDPDEPSLTVLRLRDETYVEEARVTGDQAYQATEPFEVTVVPNRLLEGL